MSISLNEFGQPVGERVADWIVPAELERVKLQGRYCVLEPLVAESHSQQLFAAFTQDQTDQNWTYLPYGPFCQFQEFKAWLAEQEVKVDPLFYAVIESSTGLALGVASFMRINRSMGVVEIGHINFSPQLQQTATATEALYLMIRHVFSLGYRRCEWKCNALNEASCRAALRLGFSYEGTFRQAAVIKGRNRDTAWYSLLNTEWSAVQQAFDAWLSPDNFDADGQQKQRLSILTSNVAGQPD